MPVKAPQPVFRRDESVGAGLVRIVDELVESAVVRVKEPSPDREEDLHQVRLAIKRLRAILRLLRPLVRPEFFERENARLRSAARRLARLRDLAVARRTLEQVTNKLASHPPPAVLQEVFDRFLAQTPALSRYDEDREKALGLAAKALEQNRRALRGLPLPDHGWKTIEPGLKALYRQNRVWMGRALHRNNDEDFHEWRKRMKSYFYSLKLLTPMWPKHLRKLEKQLNRLQDDLGKDHDLAVLKRFVLKNRRRHAGETPLENVVKYLEKRSVKLRKKSIERGGKLFEDKPGCWMKVLRERWKGWANNEVRMTKLE